MLEYVIIGFFSLLVGLMSLFIDPKTDKTKASLVVGALILSASVTGAYGYYDSKDSKSTADKQLDVAKQAVDEGKELKALNATMETDLHTLMRREGIPVSEGDVPSQPASVAAAAPSAPASRPIIEYFAKDNEGDGVTKALRDAGLDVIKLPGQLPGPTNSIWAGDHVTMAEVKPVALTLLRAGVQLKAVRHFRDGSGAKDRLIEIGSDHAFANAPVLTEEQVQNMADLPKR
jgi:hypothetical protein